jgi:DNA-binding NarL/FixJ family response regulator
LDTGLINVAIVEDDLKIRQGLAALIDSTTEFRCTDTFESVEDALGRIAGNLPDVVLMDIGLPAMSGIEGIRVLRRRFPSLHLLVLTVYGDDTRIFDAFCAGACGYLLKKTPPEALLESIRQALAGGGPMSPQVARRVIELFRQVRAPERTDFQITPHEARVLKLLSAGYNYEAAAFELGISVNTLRFHVKSIYEKLHVHSKSEAVGKALRSGIIR